MSIPRTASSDATAIAMSDLEDGKKGVNVTVTSVDSPQRPIIGRRKTTNETVQVDGVEQKLGYSGEEDGLTKVGNFFWKIHRTSILT